jgi:hypothetical protein
MWHFSQTERFNPIIMSSRRPLSSTQTKQIAETVALAAVGLGTAVLCVTNKRFRDAVTEAIGSPELGSPKPSAAPSASTPRTSSGQPVTGGEGVVYLLKAGPFYKIGKAQDFSKRLRQIKLQLPYPVESVHTISCGDISHVERYWHKRFASKKQNGEWFILTNEDVAEFAANKRM